MLQIAVVTEGETFLATALSVEFDEVTRNVLDMFFGALLESFPLACAQRGETRTLTTILRTVLRHLI